MTLAEAQSLHRAGQLEAAKQHYLALLQQEPDNTTLLHYLAMLYAEQQNWDAAQHCLEKALCLQPSDPIFALHLANTFKARGLLEQAEQTLHTLIAAHPNYAAGFNNLGTIYYAQKKSPEAINAFLMAIELQANYVDAYYNLGLAYSKSQALDKAMHTFAALLELAPDHPGAHFQLGCLLMQREQYQAALKQFNLLGQQHPFHFETQVNMAACLLMCGWMNEAKTYYLKALDVVPTDTQTLFNLGVIAMQQGHLNQAIDYYLRVLRIAPDTFDAQNNVGVAYLALKNKAAALTHFQAALRLSPGDRAVQHTIDILHRQKNLSATPAEYVRTLFDSYAGHYDAHLTHTLHYQVPVLLQQALQSVTALPSAQWDIVDLGCGTGLCGEIFKSYAKQLVGVDLSEKMLHIAAQKKCYNELVHADILTFLANKNGAYDLVLAGDVFIYYGDLAPVLLAVQQALRPQGLLAFSVEAQDQQPYSMTEAGRFAHSKKYIDGLATHCQLTVVRCNEVTLRTQDDVPVKGYIYVMRSWMKKFV